MRNTSVSGHGTSIVHRAIFTNLPQIYDNKQESVCGEIFRNNLLSYTGLPRLGCRIVLACMDYIQYADSIRKGTVCHCLTSVLSFFSKLKWQINEADKSLRLFLL